MCARHVSLLKANRQSLTSLSLQIYKQNELNKMGTTKRKRQATPERMAKKDKAKSEKAQAELAAVEAERIAARVKKGHEEVLARRAADAEKKRVKAVAEEAKLASPEMQDMYKRYYPDTLPKRQKYKVYFLLRYFFVAHPQFAYHTHINTKIRISGAPSGLSRKTRTHGHIR